jgi:hypothetical protein
MKCAFILSLARLLLAYNFLTSNKNKYFKTEMQIYRMCKVCIARAIQDYDENDVIQFLKEEFDRITTRYPF